MLLACTVVSHTDAKSGMVREDCERSCFTFIFGYVVGIFGCMVCKNQETPKLSSMADDAITRGGIGGLGSLVYICAL